VGFATHSTANQINVPRKNYPVYIAQTILIPHITHTVDRQ